MILLSGDPVPPIGSSPVGLQAGPSVKYFRETLPVSWAATQSFAVIGLNVERSLPHASPYTSLKVKGSH